MERQGLCAVFAWAWTSSGELMAAIAWQTRSPSMIR